MRPVPLARTDWAREAIRLLSSVLPLICMAGCGSAGSLSNAGKNTDIKRPMDFPTLTPAHLVRRHKRFLADVELPGREGAVCVHCPNTGAMTGCETAGARIWLSSHDSPKRKLPWTWELIETDVGLVCIHSARANRVVEEGLLGGLFPALMAPQGNLEREALLGHRSRADFLIPASPDILVEVKAVTIFGGWKRGVSRRGQSAGHQAHHRVVRCDGTGPPCGAHILCVALWNFLGASRQPRRCLIRRGNSARDADGPRSLHALQ